MSIESFIKTELSKLCISSDQPHTSSLNPNELDLDIPLINYGLDSVRAFELICLLEDEFDVDIDNTAIAKLKTARALIDHISIIRG